MELGLAGDLILPVRFHALIRLMKVLCLPASLDAGKRAGLAIVSRYPT
jgi:hypothetical protein